MNSPDELDSPPDFNRQVTDEIYEELVDQLEGKRIVGVALWEESLADDEEARPEPDAREIFDFDLYLDNRLYLELYGTLLFPDLDSDPLQGLEPVGTMLAQLVERNLWLNEVAVSEEDELVLILGYEHRPRLYLNVGGWTLDEWESLPDETQA